MEGEKGERIVDVAVMKDVHQDKKGGVCIKHGAKVKTCSYE